MPKPARKQRNPRVPLPAAIHAELALTELAATVDFGRTLSAAVTQFERDSARLRDVSIPAPVRDPNSVKP
jgi:hypothetical protein